MQKLIGSSVIVLEGPNLIANPSVETEGAPGWPANWFHTLSGVAWATPGCTGERSLRLNPVNEMSDWRAEVFPVAGGKTYRVRLYVKGTASHETILAFRWFSDDNGANWIGEQWLWLEGSYPDWTLRDALALVPATARSADVMFRVFADSTADLVADDFYVGELP